MTDREKTIVTAYTGVTMLQGEKLDLLYDYVSKLIGRPVQTLDFVYLADKIQELSKPDFIKLCAEDTETMTDREKAIEILQRLADGKSEDLYIFDDEGGGVCGQILEEQDAILLAIEALKTCDECVWYKERPHGEWEVIGRETFSPTVTYRCSVCKAKEVSCIPNDKPHYCENCGASMLANDRQVTGKLNEPKDSHAEYWNSIGEWKEGDEE